MVNSICKGRNGEREWARFCRDRGFDGARRGQQYCGANGDADVVGISNNLHCEVKRVERLNIHDAMIQAVEDARHDEVPIVAHRKNNTHWLVTLDAGQFLEIWAMLTDEQREAVI